jgi:hypothetical protein
MIEEASPDDLRAIEEINNRILGKPIQPLGTPDKAISLLLLVVVEFFKLPAIKSEWNQFAA